MDRLSNSLVADNFDVKRWINATLAKPVAAEAVEATLATVDDRQATSVLGASLFVKLGLLENGRGTPRDSHDDTDKRNDSMILAAAVRETVTELQLVMQLSAQQLERLVDELAAAVPRALQDLDAIVRDVAQLAAALPPVASVASVASASATTGSGSGSGSGSAPAAGQRAIDSTFAGLAAMDLVLQRMEQTRVCLREAENWSSLPAEIDAVLAARDFAKAARRLADARRSLALLHSSLISPPSAASAAHSRLTTNTDLIDASPALVERRALLARLQADLLALVRPALEAALSDSDQQTGSDLDVIGRFRDIYVELDDVAAFDQLYSRTRCSSLLAFWASRPVQATYSDQVVADDATWLQQVLDQIASLVVKELSQPFYGGNSAFDRIQSAQALVAFVFDNLSPRFPDWLRSVTQVRFARNESPLSLLVNLHAMCAKFVQNLHARFMTLVPKEVGVDDTLLSDTQWAAVILDAFTPYQHGYLGFEQRGLKSLLPDYSRRDAAAITGFINDYSSKLISACEAVLARCDQFTYGHGIHAAVQVIDEFVASFTTASALLLQSQQMFVQAGNTSILVAGVSASFGSSLSNVSTSATITDDQQNLDDEWSDFRAAVTLYNVVVGVDVQFRALVESITTRLGVTPSINRSSIASRFLESALQAGQVAFSKPSLHSLPFSASQSAMTLLANASQMLVFECLLRRVARHLDDLPIMDCWNSTTKTVSSPFDLQLPEFSLLPLTYITRVGEQLLALPLHLDTFSGEACLKFSVQTLPGLLPSDLQSESDDEMDVTHLWISAIARAVESRYMDKALQIPVLSPHGRRQLATDINYLCNVLRAMEIEIHPRLESTVRQLESTDTPLSKLQQQ